MNQELQTTQQPSNIISQLSATQQGWLRLASIREQLFTDLQNAELSVQATLADIETKPLTEIQTAIKTAKATYNDAKEKRLAFTRLIDEKLLTPSMEFEKRMLANIEPATKKEVEVRKAESDKANAIASHQLEVTAFKTHVVNQWHQLAAEYRASIEREITATYTNCLKAKVPVAGIEPIITTLAQSIREIKLSTPTKYPRALVTDQEAREIVANIAAYNPASDLAEYIATLHDRFANYELDLANSEAAAAAIEQEAKQREQEAQQELLAEQATNVLIAQAETVTVQGPTVKRELKIIVIESEAWAQTVIANFMKNWPRVSKFVRVKSWSKLTIAQMAEALGKHATETGEVFNGLQTEEIVK